MESNGVSRTAILVAAFACALACGAAACAADTSVNDAAPVDDGAEVDELNATSLRGSTAMKGTVAAGSTVTLQYDRSDRVYPRSVPYLAVEIVDAPVASSSNGLHPMNGELVNGQSITLHGDFPGRPRVLVVDADFKPIASVVAQTLPDGTAQATLDVARGQGKRFVLVRDTRWSKPMEFQVGVGR
ncbi:MAG: hypothetical protein JWO86_3370 [Myxococcaceae bacterium]|jgi:hypothetical protein|nr:hypothetical protein [Myxococcaceae bacterium]